MDFARPAQVWNYMPQRLTVEGVKLAVSDDAPLTRMSIKRGGPLLGLHDIAVGLGELLARCGGHMVHCSACHDGKVAAGCVNHPIFTVEFRRTGNALNDLLYRFALEKPRTHSVSDFVQSIRF